jgi:UDP:flavonoid glycosyltransferase YjiC (YdhE family)
VKLGLGPSAPIFRMVSGRSPSKAIRSCLDDERYRKRAEEIARELQGTDGVALTLQEIEREAWALPG